MNDSEKLSIAKKAVNHVLRAICGDPRKYYLMGPLTGSYDNLVEAYAALNDMSVQDVEKIAVPDRERYNAYLEELKQQEAQR